MIFFSKNLKFLRKTAGLTQGELAKEIGAKPNTISNYESEVSEPDYKTLDLIIKKLGVSANQILFEDLDQASTEKGNLKGNPKGNPSENANLNANLSENAHLNAHPSEKVAANIAANIAANPKHGVKDTSIELTTDQPAEGPEPTGRYIPILDAKAAAGWPANVDNPKFWGDMRRFYPPDHWFIGGQYMVIQVEGDSMHPTIYNGDYLIIRRIMDPREIKDGYVYVILTADGAVCKRVLNRLEAKKQLALQSDNAYYNTYIEPISNIIQVWEVKMKMSSIFRNENLDILRKINTMEADIAELKAGKKKH